ncbi:unnamed protein product [Ilex paraguariensis]|uniref:Sucrose phosphate synthase n=1 Tax=Ilex paraguariensis TaxID=185542 RepID=A0ABC8QWA0_9AQUA
MAGNEWINGYLEAILDAGSGKYGLKGSVVKGDEDRRNKNNINNSMRKRFDEKLRSEKFEDKEKEEKLFSPTKYFVDEVINSFDETDLHRTWIKVIATRHTRERNNRLENMCWRIWHLARRKKQVLDY